MSHFMVVLIPYINLFNFSWIIKCLFLRNMAPLSRDELTFLEQCSPKLYTQSPVEQYKVRSDCTGMQTDLKLHIVSMPLYLIACLNDVDPVNT